MSLLTVSTRANSDIPESSIRDKARAQKPLRAAVVGCGAIAELGHVPAIRGSKLFRLAALADLDRERARVLAGGDAVLATNDYREAIDAVDLAVVATPPSSHRRIALDFLERGKAVLIEKPMCLRAADALQIFAAAEASGAAVAVGHSRRFALELACARELISESLAFGEIRRVIVRFGFPIWTRWPAASSYLQSREQAGGGVLANLGPHVFDLILGWFGEAELVRYQDDSRGGMEANAQALLRAGSSIEVEVRLSSSEALRPLLEIECSNATVWVEEGAPRLLARLKSGREAVLEWRGVQPLGDPELMREQLENFHRHLAGLEPLACPPEHALRVVELIEESYARREPLEPAWSA